MRKYNRDIGYYNYKMTTADKYIRMTDLEHVKHRPGMFIGGIQNVEEVRWIVVNKTPETDEDGNVVDNKDDKDNEDNGLNGEEAIQRIVKSNPGLEQCVMEILTNAADHAQRVSTNPKKDHVTTIKINLKKDHISVQNDGLGIPFDFKEEYGVRIPEMIFGMLRTSSNYDDTQERIVGGTNGYGVKLANIFSKKFVIELQTGGQTYYQEFYDRMDNKTEPVIGKATTIGDYTKVVFYPDFKVFGMESFATNETALLIKKRVYDLSSTTSKGVSVWFNDTPVPIKDFSDYMKLYIGNSTKVVYNHKDKDKPNEICRWEVGFAKNPYDKYTHISFVNTINTEDGGNHVEHVIEEVITNLTTKLQKKNPTITIKKQYVKDNIIVFVKSLIVNPSFDSQLKRKLITKVSQFGSKCEIPENVIEQISKCGICDGVVEIATAKERMNVLKTISATKRGSLNDIEKLSDAGHAGKSKAMQCTLILTEGDSAKTLAMSGIPAAGGSDFWGAFPLRGKLINVRTASMDKLKNNEEIKAINRILGLSIDTKTINELRYGKVMFMSDQDLDGFHIKGLLINYFTKYWPHLVKQGFLECLITPVVKVSKNKQKVAEFYNINDFKRWVEVNDRKNFLVTYYKGLGTSSSDEASEYFANIEKNKIRYVYDIKAEAALERTFEKNNTNERKEWIARSKNAEIDYNIKNVAITDFIDQELVQFSTSDVVRSIPSVMDGLKPSQRKILYTCILKRIYLTTEGAGASKVTKVASLVTDTTEYHHGEVSLYEAIINMAQDFVGTNNINLMLPIGQFGSRQTNKDSAAPRYINTALNNIVKIIYNEIDNKLLKYKEDEGTIIEPEYFVPIIPMLLVNGSSGIGTGWSTDVPCFNPQDLIDNIRLLLTDKDSVLKEMKPYYKNFKGIIIRESENHWISEGAIDFVDTKTIEIVELPVGHNAPYKVDYKRYLDALVEAGHIKSYSINDSIKNNKGKKIDANRICYLIKLIEPMSKESFTKRYGEYIQMFKLRRNINGTNMVAFDANNNVKKYASVYDILWEFYEYRLGFYKKRLDKLISDLNEDIDSHNQKYRFINMVMTGEIVLNKKKRQIIEEELQKLNFKNIDKLLAMHFYHCTYEELEKLRKQIEELQKTLSTIMKKTEKELWFDDLALLEKKL